MTHSLTLAPLRSLRLARSLTLRATGGRLWVTIEGDTADHVLATGQTLALPARRHVIVEALDAGATGQLASVPCAPSSHTHCAASPV